jgi:hypothetical protein
MENFNQLTTVLAKFEKVINTKVPNDRLHKIYFDAITQNFVASDGHLMLWQKVENIFGTESFYLTKDNFVILQKYSSEKCLTFVKIEKDFICIKSNGIEQKIPIELENNFNKFVNWLQVVPEKDNLIDINKIAFNPNLLKTLLIDIHPIKSTEVRFYFSGQKRATLIEFKISDRLEVDYAALIMPLFIEY